MHPSRPKPLLFVISLLAVAFGLAPTANAVEVGTNSDATWGISTDDMDRSVALMDEAGVEWVRMAVSWKSVEPNEKGAYNIGYLDGIQRGVSRAHAAGMEVLMEFDTVPYWASADPDKRIDSSGTKRWNYYWRPREMSDYADAFGYVVRRFASQGVHVYEVWNEPNHAHFWPSGVNPNAYASMLKSTYPAIKQADPQATVLGGVVSQNDWRYLDAIYDAGAGDSFDAVATHSYPSASPTRCWDDASGHRDKNAWCSVAEMRRVMVAHGDSGKDVWIDEFGWSTCDNSASNCWGSGFTAAEQADYTYKALVELEKYPYVKAALQYNFRNTWFKYDDPNDWGANLGLIRTDFTKKPAFGAFKDYTTQAQTPVPPGGAAPTVELTSPVEGGIFGRGLAISAKAADDASVAKVEFLIDGKVVGTDGSAPYSFAYKAPKRLAYNAHTVSAKAYDEAGQRSTDEVSVTRVKSASLTLAIKQTSLAGSLLGLTDVLATGLVEGVSAGEVVLRLQRASADGWETKAKKRVPVSIAGTYAGTLRRTISNGSWRVRARYLGTSQFPASSARVQRLH